MGFRMGRDENTGERYYDLGDGQARLLPKNIGRLGRVEGTGEWMIEPADGQRPMPLADFLIRDSRTLPSALLEGFQNIPESGARFVTDLAGAVTSPIETATGLAKTIAGGLQNFAPGDILGTGYQPYSDALIDFFKDRYAGWGNFKNTLATDPIGILGDASTFAGGVGLGLKGVSLGAKAGKLGQAAHLLNKGAEYAAKGSKYTDPLTLAGKGVDSGINRLTGGMGLPEKLYQSALKPTTTPKDRNPLQRTLEKVRTGLLERLPPNQDGFDKLQRLQNALGQQAGKTVNDYLARTGPGAADINLGRLATKAGLESIDEFAHMSDPISINKAINNKVDSILKAHAPNGELIDLRKAQDLKIGFGREASNFIGTPTPTTIQGAKMSVVDNMRDGLMKVIEDRVPDIAGVNKRNSALHALRDDLKRAAIRNQNNNIFSLLSLAGGTGAAFGGSLPGTMVGLSLAAAGSPLAKAKLAFGLNDLRNLPNTKYGQVGMPPFGLPYRQAWRLEQERKKQQGILGFLDEE